jgi:hypothetical protein
MFIKVMAGLVIILTFFGIFAVVISSLNGLLLMGVAGTTVIFMIWREYVHNPKEVSFGQNEMTLIFRYSKPLQVRYDDIVWLAIPFSGRLGGMKVKKRYSFGINSDICLELKDRMNDETRMARPGGI